MIQFIIIIYWILFIACLAVHERLMTRKLKITCLCIALVFYVLSFYLYKISYSPFDKNTSVTLTIWFYFIIIHHFLKKRFIKETNLEPIFVMYSQYSNEYNRKADYRDYIYTLLLVIIPAFFCFITTQICKFIM